ncbi:hypothetical protein [Candidatus Methanomassiliicoccus intestinalis]|uniref:hypothetical protein n=1 Tax=Candidatus Methanomassiliicoccus intestinalis TaxID=1406512 RepID=UPI0037DDDE4A
MTDQGDLNNIVQMIKDDPFNIDLYFQRGIIWYELRCYDECASDLMFYESCGGLNVQYKKYLGMALSKTSSKRSLEYLNEYVNAVMDDMEALVFLAETYFENGDCRTSAALYKRAVEKGYDPTILRIKAAALSNMKQYDEAAFFDPAFGKKSLFRR